MKSPAGRINKRFGTDGGVMLSFYDTFPEEFSTDCPLMVKIDGLDVPLYCDRLERHGIGGAIAHFADFDTERRAEELLGLEFRLGNEAPDEEDEADDTFYLEDLIGFQVLAEESGRKTKYTGTLTDYYDSETNPLFGLEIEGREVLVPAVEEFIAHIDFKRRTIHMIVPAGLITD